LQINTWKELIGHMKYKGQPMISEDKWFIHFS